MGTILRRAVLMAVLCLAASTVLSGCADVDAVLADDGNVGALIPGDGAAGFQPDVPLFLPHSTSSKNNKIQVYFTSPQYPDVKSARIRTVENAMIDIIDSAEKSLDLAIYMLDLDDVVNAVLNARKRGVAVRVVTDSSSLKEMADFERLKKAGIRIVDDRRDATMHDKFMIVDGDAVWTGSNNWTESCLYWNNNNAVFVRSPKLAADYAAEFEEMYLDYQFGESSPLRLPFNEVNLEGSIIQVCMSPEGKCARKVIDVIMNAEKSIRFMTFAFTHDGIGEAVERQIHNGLDVAGVLETRDAENPAGEYSKLRSLDERIVLDGNPYYMHHKVFILDEEIVITGSYNYSRNADEYNDENMLIIHDDDVAVKYLEEFARIFDQAENPPEK